MRAEAPRRIGQQERRDLSGECWPVSDTHHADLNVRSRGGAGDHALRAGIDGEQPFGGRGSVAVRCLGQFVTLLMS
jgi:hypothetical protein